MSLEGADISGKRRPHGPLLQEHVPSEGCEGADNHPSCSQSPHDKAVSLDACISSKGALEIT